MKSIRRGTLIAGLALLGGCQTAAVRPISGIAQAEPSTISTQRMSEITRVLASDAFEGRSMGTPGEEKTVAYLDRAVQGGRPRTGRREGRLDAGGAADPDQASGARRSQSRKARPAHRSLSPATSISAPFATRRPPASPTHRSSSSATARRRPNGNGTTSRAPISRARSRCFWSTTPISKPPPESRSPASSAARP